MKAAVYRKYGTPEVLQVEEVEKPVPNDDEVLVKISAVSINASDWELLTGQPLYARIFGVFRPRVRILGSDIAGTVEAVGKNVTRFQPGNEVFGDIFEYFGGFAEYVAVPQSMLMSKPASLSFVQAAALPQSATIALQGLRNKKIHRLGQVQPGEKVLINGAGGGSGSFAVQMAKAFGAEVTGVDNTEKLDAIRAAGADHVVDYTRDDFTRSGERYDLILDLAAHHSIFDYQRALNPGGHCLVVGGAMSSILQLLFPGPLVSLATGKKTGFLALKMNQGLGEVLELIESGKIVPMIDRCYSLDDIADALRYLGEGHARGKVVITLKDRQ